MNSLLAAILLAALSLNTTPAPVASEANGSGALLTFLRAADQNDFEAMRMQMSGKARPTKFIAKVNGCYLRRVYGHQVSGSIIAAWMCAEGDRASRVVLASLSLDKENKVLVEVVREDRNKVPAPARSGSALAD